MYSPVIPQKPSASTRSSTTGVWSRSEPSGTSTVSPWRGNLLSSAAVLQRAKRSRTWRMKWRRLATSHCPREALTVTRAVMFVRSGKAFLSHMVADMFLTKDSEPSKRPRRMQRSCDQWWCPWSMKSLRWRPSWPQQRTEWRNWRLPRLVSTRWSGRTKVQVL